jgi:hypothetical protein
MGMICKNCGHNIVQYFYSIPTDVNSSKTVYVYYHMSGFIKYGKSYCWERVGPVTGEVKGWLDPTEWCLCDNPEPPEVEKYEFTSTTQ